MKDLELFKYGLRFQNWGELYLGCKAMWISPQDVLSFCESQKIKHSTSEIYISLLLAFDDSYFQFLERLKDYIYMYDHVSISKNEDESTDNYFEYIPSIFFKIWELEFLIEIINSPIDIGKKLHNVAILFDKMNYPETWKPFLFYQQQNGSLTDEESLYFNLIQYVEEQKENFRS